MYARGPMGPATSVGKSGLGSGPDQSLDDCMISGSWNYVLMSFDREPWLLYVKWIIAV